MSFALILIKVYIFFFLIFSILTSKAFANIFFLRRYIRKIIDWDVLIIKYFLFYYSFIFALPYYILQLLLSKIFAILLHNVNSFNLRSLLVCTLI